MEPPNPISLTFKALSLLLLLILSFTCVASARILEEPLQASTAAPAQASNPSEITPVANSAPAATPVVPPVSAPVDELVSDEAPPAAAPVTGTPTVPVVDPVGEPNAGATATANATVANADPHHSLSFFMHDILGGSNPSALAVTGIVTNPAVNGQVPFAKPNGAVLPVNNGVPINNGNSAVINSNNSNNLPFLTGLGGNTNTVIQNNGRNSVNGGLPFINGAQLPSGTGIQNLMFGTMTVIDNELTEGHELGSGLVGKAQGFYISSSVDGSRQTMAFTAMFESGQYVDSLSFFGVHRTAVSEFQLAIMGGTGKYVNAKGFATVKTIPAANQVSTDGLETLLQFTVYLA